MKMAGVKSVINNVKNVKVMESLTALNVIKVIFCQMNLLIILNMEIVRNVLNI